MRSRHRTPTWRRLLTQAAWLSAVPALLVTSLLAYAGHSDRRGEAELRARAERVYESNRRTQQIPAHLIRTLSIALAFGDYAGARRLIEALEVQGAQANR